VLENDDKNVDPLFTPTTVQVAAGILSGLSYLMETGRKPGYYQPCDLNTQYILDKARPLLGNFFFTEIPASAFNKSLTLKNRK
jgi:homospermidine synthase